MACDDHSPPKTCDVCGTGTFALSHSLVSNSNVDTSNVNTIEIEEKPTLSELTLHDEIVLTRTMLKSAWEAEEKTAEISCPIKGGEKYPPHAGDCCGCTKKTSTAISHQLPRSDDALEEATKLMKTLSQVEDIGDKGAQIKLLQESGSMFGVLVCIDANGSRVVLKAFSGAFDGTEISNVEGWCPPIAAQDSKEEERLRIQMYEEKKKHDERVQRIKAIATEIEVIKAKFTEIDEAIAKELKRIGQLELTKEEWQKLGIEPPSTTPEKSSPEYKTVAEKMWTPLNTERKKKAQEKTDVVQKLEKERTEKTIICQKDKSYDKALGEYRMLLAKSRTITNYRGETASLLDACCPQSETIATNNQLGQCAAPKLLAEARRRGLIPVSLAEFWYGAATQARKHEQFYESCQFCRSIMGFALCGLIEEQKKLFKKFEK